jgi:hypothetical protein
MTQIQCFSSIFLLLNGNSFNLILVHCLDTVTPLAHKVQSSEQKDEPPIIDLFAYQ